MKIAINILPLKSGHRDRGIGLYTNNLIESIKKKNSLEVQEFNHLSEVKKADIIHYPWFDFFSHTLPIIKKFKTVVTIHDVIPLMFPKQYPVGLKGRFNLMFQKLSLRNCHSLITDSKASKKDIVKYLQVNADKISVVYLAANQKFKTQKETQLLHIKRKYNLPDRFLLYVGDANWTKNIPFLLEGFNRLIQISELKDIKLVLVGGVFLKNVENIEHPELESLKQANRLIQNNKLSNYIIRPGVLKLDELISFYSLATVYIQPSIYEGFGLPIIEAFSCGTPVVSSNRGSLMEIGGDAPVYFDPTNLSQFVAILRDVLGNKSLQNKLSKLGLKRAEQFSWEKVAKETINVYTNIFQND